METSAMQAEATTSGASHHRNRVRRRCGRLTIQRVLYIKKTSVIGSFFYASGDPLPRLDAVPKMEGISGGLAPAGRGDDEPTAGPAIARHTELYRVVYQEGQRALDDQVGELNSMRDRAVQFTAFVGAATAFLVGAGLSGPHRDVTFYVLAGTASALSALLILLLFALLTPQTRRMWTYRLSTKSLISGWIETEVPLPTEADFYKKLAIVYDEMREENTRLLRVLRTWYRYLIVVGAGQVTVWAALVWVRA
jgi:hypothetical protein